MPPAAVPLPSFLIIGAQKSATRWLRHNLGLHPEIFTADYELAFFNRRRYQMLGADWYRAQFDGWAGEPFVGEATPGYMIWRHGPRAVARRIKDTIPDARLIAILRNPVDRANSAMVHHKRRERIRPNAKLLDLVRAEPPGEERFSLVSGGWYAASLRPYQQLFGERLLVLLHDDVRDDTLLVYERALRHIGAPSGFVPPNLSEVVFSNQLGERGRGEQITPEDRVELYQYFADDIRKLERMFDLDLSAWRPIADADAETRRAAQVLERYEAANAWIEAVVGNVAPGQYSDPTLEAGTTVRMLLDHLIDSALYLSGLLRTRPLTSEERAQVDEERAQFASNPLAAYRYNAGLLRHEMAQALGVGPAMTTPSRRRALRRVADASLTNQLADGWELAVSTGQPATIPAGLVEPVAGTAREMVAWQPERIDSGNGMSADHSATVGRFLSSLEAAARPSRP